MASAPRPGSAGTTGGDSKARAASTTITLTLRPAEGEPIVRTFRPGAVPFSERLIVRKATGLPFEAFASGEDGVGLDTIQVWWWLAARGDNPLCTLEQALSEWPAEVDEDTFDITVDDGTAEDDSPEA